ncbi:MAG: hypothetical protein N3G76_03030 [Candidatus Micrarchaeota archaeon]|nr:hypothetical protein [Candidatus Micrarchaeota archaeon]
MALMVVEANLYARAAYFIICVILLAVYNVVHARGLELSLGMLTKKKMK